MRVRSAVIMAVLASAIVIAAVAVAVTSSSDHPDTPVDPDKPVYPSGITFDERTGTLHCTRSVEWTVVPQLPVFDERKPVTYSGNDVRLDTGLYSVTVGSDTFNVIVGGTVHRDVSYEYWFKGDYYPVSIGYDIDVDELSKITLENRRWNATTDYMFVDTPRLVYVDDTVRSIESQLASRFAEIGGSVDDRQGYADFLAGFAQLAIDYPIKSGQDYRVWGSVEYWAISLETLYHASGDCEDSAAVAASLFIAAGYDTAMVGVPGHVVAGVHIDQFVPRDMEEFATYNSTYGVFVPASRPSVVEGDPQDIIYQGVETTEGQAPVGYLLNGSEKSLGKKTLYWGISGFYPVHTDDGGIQGSS